MPNRKKTYCRNFQLTDTLNKCLLIFLTVLFLLLLADVEHLICPALAYIQEDDDQGSQRVMSLLGALPLYQYTYQAEQVENGIESRNILQYISSLQIVEDENAPEEVTDSEDLMRIENEEAAHTGIAQDNIQSDSDNQSSESYVTDEDSLESASSQVISDNISGDLIKAESPSMLYDLTQFEDLDLLLQEFYAVDTSTSVTSDKLSLDSLLSYDLTLEPGSDNPQILIYHTHSQEAFTDSVSGDSSTTIVGVGEKLAELLRSYGYNVMHHTGEYDVEDRDAAYGKAAPAVEQILEENPSIEVIIDLHRDDFKHTKVVTEIDGKPVAKIMFFNGLSYNNQLGEITYLPNPNLKENLAFSFQAQVIANQYYPGLMRKIYLRGYRYNMQYRGKCMLVELGGNTNTVEEAMNAAEPLAHIIAMTLGCE